MACEFREKCDKYDMKSKTCKSYTDSREYCGIAKELVRNDA
jgi:hypothetical protein